MKDMKKSKSSNKKRLVMIMLSFILSFFLFLLGILVVFQSTVFNTNYMRKQLGASNYYENVIEEVEDKFSSYASASGFDQDFFKTTIDINDVQFGVNQSLSILYGNNEESVDTSKFETNLYNKLVENVQGRKIEITDQIDDSLHLLAKTCADTYGQYISIPYSQELAPFISKLKTPVFILEMLLAFFIILILAVIYKMNHWRHRAIRAYIYAISGAVLMVSVIPIVILLSGIVNRLSIISKSVYTFAIYYINGILYTFLCFSIVLIIIDLLLALVYYFMKNKAIHYSEIAHEV